MKIVVSKEQVAHLFAHQSQQEARVSGGNFYFNGDTIYSYGSHFPIAKHVTNKAGDKALLFTTRGWSVTTSGQIYVVRSATSHLNKIYCHNPNNSHSENLEQYVKDVEAELANLERARKPEKYIIPAQNTAENCKKYCEFFGLTFPERITVALEKATAGKYSEYLSAKADILAKEEKAKQKKIATQFRKDLKKWRGKEIYRLYSRPFDRDYLRLNGDNVQTSQNIEISLATAKRAFGVVLKKLAKGGCTECKFYISDTTDSRYEVKEVNEKFMHIGCHKIYISEIQAFATSQGW